MLNPLVVSDLAASLQGRLLRPDSEGYDEARTVWNAMIDRRPSIIVQPENVADVSKAIGFACDYGMMLSIRGGGHNIAGSGICANGLAIDLSTMRTVQIDKRSKRARVAGGALLSDLDRESQAVGLATTGGVVSSTGVAGLALGGGFGWLARKHGLAIDNLLGVELVTADGQVTQANPKENPDLFWAVRGGGGNFGVVTSFDFQLHDLAHPILFGPVLYDLGDARTILRNYRNVCPLLPREYTVWADLFTSPNLPHIPEKFRGKRVLSLMHCYIGDPLSGSALTKKMESAVSPILSNVQEVPYVAAQQFLDETYAHGARNYWSTQCFTALSDNTIDAIIQLAHEMPSAESDILISQLGGAIDDIAPDSSAYPHRGVQFMISPGARWRKPADDELCVTWAKRAGERLSLESNGGAYVNFLANASTDGINAFGDNLIRLRQIKRKFDPNNLFRLNQNITPAE